MSEHEISFFFVKPFERNISIILHEDFLENPPFQGKNVLKEIFIKYYVKCFGKFYEGGLARIWLMMNFGYVGYLLKILLKITMLAYIFKMICVMVIVETVLKFIFE